MMAPHAAGRGNLGESVAYTTPSEVEKVLEAPDRRPNVVSILLYSSTQRLVNWTICKLPPKFLDPLYKAFTFMN